MAELLLCSHYPNDAPPAPRTSAERIHSRGTGRRASVQCMAEVDFNPLYTGGLFHCYMLKSQFVTIGVSGLFCCFYSTFGEKILLANNEDSDILWRLIWVCTACP